MRSSIFYVQTCTYSLLYVLYTDFEVFYLVKYLVQLYFGWVAISDTLSCITAYRNKLKAILFNKIQCNTSLLCYSNLTFLQHDLFMDCASSEVSVSLYKHTNVAFYYFQLM